MTQAIINLGEYQDRILNIVKGKYGLKNKSDAVNLVINQFGEQLLEPELKPEYVKKIKNLDDKKRFKQYSSINSLRAEIENA
jgi:hypothetical protein